MAKSKKTKTEVQIQGDAVTDALKGIEVPKALQARFIPQLVKVRNRVWRITENLAKAIEQEATKDEREAKKAERETKRVEKLVAQIEKAQAKLKELKKS